MIICLREHVAWLEVRLNRRRGFARRTTHFGKVFEVLPAKAGSYDFVIKDMWAGPLVIRLEHWRQTDA